ncbi:MAG TPA: AzlC family ABC transporter permease [Desulfobacteria bacterium]|nr:AzlC family ABC transporter permease [Desulfobacteria bacterium]
MSRSVFFEGAKKAVPIMLGYTPLGIAFGVVAREQGLTVLQTTLMSLTAFTGSGQFLAVGMLGAGAGISAILLTNFLINLRYLLFSASMAPFVKRVPAIIQSVLAFGITDETFAVNMNEFNRQETDYRFILGVNMFSHLSWIANSALGAALGNFIPDIDRYGINFALTAMFIALLILQVKNKKALYVALISAVLSIVLAVSINTSVNVIAATVISATLGVVLCRSKPKSTS